MDTLIEMQTDLVRLNEAIETEAVDAQQRMKRLTDARTALGHRIGIVLGGMDAEKIDLGLSVLEIYGTYTGGGDDRASVIRDAVHWLATGKSKAYAGLDREYYGTKRYDRWYGQRSDHQPGMGPSHGSIIFSVGLKRARVPDRREFERALSLEEREAAIYTLLNLERIESARAAA